MTTADKNAVLKEIERLNARRFHNKSIVKQTRKNKMKGGWDWAFSVFQLDHAGEFDLLISDPTEIISFAKDRGVGFYVSSDAYVSPEEHQGMKNKPYIRLY